jgi:hypothetical protein
LKKKNFSFPIDAFFQNLTFKFVSKGTKPWPSGCQLKYVNGFDFKLPQSTSFQSNMSAMSIPVQELNPNETIDLSVSMRSPEECGIYQCQLRLYTENNQPFGDEIWVICTVEQSGILGITQQLTNVNMFDLHRSTTTSNNSNKTFAKLDSNSSFINPFKNSNSTATTAPTVAKNLF